MSCYYVFNQGPVNRRLNEITKQDVSLHEMMLRDLQAEVPHSIEVVILGKNKGLQVPDFMCFEFAFDLIYSKRYKDILESQRGWKINPISADKGFFLFLKKRNSIQKIYFNYVDDNDLIVYFRDDEPAHAGKMIKNRVRSKWGTGLLLDHEIHEFPELYGNTARFFRPISLEDCIELFIDYAGARGLEFHVINDQ